MKQLFNSDPPFCIKSLPTFSHNKMHIELLEYYSQLYKDATPSLPINTHTGIKVFNFEKIINCDSIRLNEYADACQNPYPLFATYLKCIKYHNVRLSAHALRKSIYA